MRFTDPAYSCFCEEIQITHDMADSEQPDMCVECEREWASMISRDENQAEIPMAHPLMEGMDVEGPLIEVEARMVSDLTFILEDVPPHDCESIPSTDDDEQGGALLDSFYDFVNDPSSQLHETDSIAVHEPTELISPLLRLSRAETDSGSLDLPPALVDSFISSLSKSDYFTSGYDSSDCGYSCEGSNGLLADNADELETWRGALIDAAILYPPCEADALPEEDFILGLHDPTDSILELAPTEQPDTLESTDESDCTFFDAVSDISSDKEDEYADGICEWVGKSPVEWIANMERTAARIEATVAKRIEEDYQRYRRQTIISSLLDKALFFKDQTEKRQQRTELGIEEDTHLWDTESMLEEPIASSSPFVFRLTSNHDDRKGTSSKDKAPDTHVYDGIFSAKSDQVAEARGLFAFAPIANMSGEYEGFMKGSSAAEVQHMGLKFPQHVRGCCDEVPAPWHLYHGAIYASSKESVRRKRLEEVRADPEQLGKYYGIVKADSIEDAAEQGLIDPQHARGCCIDAVFSIPPRVTHVYYGTMSAASTKEAELMGMHEAQSMPDKIDEHYGFIEAYSMEEAEGMGLRDIQHAQECCSLSHCSIPEKKQYMYYGYMFGPSEEAVLEMGLQDPLLIPGFSDKYSGVISAFSADEARNMGMFEALRVMWDSDVPLMPDFED